MTRFLPLFCLLLFSFLGNALVGQAPASKATELSIGEQLHFSSKILGEDRVLNVYLPEGYHRDSMFNYHVLYVLDGGTDEDFLHITGLTQFYSFSWIQKIPQMIVVGIVNTDRTHDFTFPSNNVEDQKHAPTHGGSAAFMQSLKEEIIPLVEERYRTSDDRTLLGQSLGGLLATQILYEHTALFNRYIIVSPSLWWDDESYLKKDLPNMEAVEEIFVAVGNEHPDMVREAEELYATLSKAIPESPYANGVQYAYFEECDHGDVLHKALMSAFEKMKFWGPQFIVD